jgi:hypothetical protein
MQIQTSSVSTPTGGFPIGSFQHGDYRYRTVTMRCTPKSGSAVRKELESLGFGVSDLAREMLLSDAPDGYDAIHQPKAEETYEVVLVRIAFQFGERQLDIEKLWRHPAMEQEGYRPIPAGLIPELRIPFGRKAMERELDLDVIIGYHQPFQCASGEKVMLAIDRVHGSSMDRLLGCTGLRPPGFRMAFAALAPAG